MGFRDRIVLPGRRVVAGAFPYSACLQSRSRAFSPATDLLPGVQTVGGQHADLRGRRIEHDRGQLDGVGRRNAL